MNDLSKITEYGRIIADANVTFTPELSAKIGAVHGSYLGGKGILVAARDYSNNSRMLKRSYIAGGMSAGIDILNLHSSPLPLVQFCIRRFGASGGVFFSSGSMNERDTSIRFYDSSGIEFSKKQIDSINEFFKSEKLKRADPSNIGSITSILQTFEVYKKAIPQFVNKNLISNSNLKVVMDCSYGPTGELAPEMMNSLNTAVIGLNTYYRPLSVKLYPDLEAVRNVASIVKASEADLGVVFDSDGSRCLLLDETGNLVDFEDIFMLFISNDDAILKSKANPILTTTSASKILDDFASNYGYKLKRIINMPGSISKKIREERGAFGASDTKKFYFPSYGPFSDGIFTTLKLLEVLAEKKEPLSSLIRNFPKSIKVHKTVNVNPKVLVNYDKILTEHYREKVIIIMDLLFGIKIVFDENTWVQVVPSLYRDALVFTSEAPKSSTSEKLISEIEKVLQSNKTEQDE
ncbi:MAG: hypothetical protein GF364_20395 [Candidatus Lokiarchaeota archaeon]|nr:hypothetical protein [Candidatus Lokiarchaeota archaeon]